MPPVSTSRARVRTGPPSSRSVRAAVDKRGHVVHANLASEFCGLPAPEDQRPRHTPNISVHWYGSPNSPSALIWSNVRSRGGSDREGLEVLVAP
jgi:hypothetical protein